MSFCLIIGFFQAYASRGYVAVAIDSRYHGERANSTTAYKDVIKYESILYFPKSNSLDMDIFILLASLVFL